MIPKEAQQAMTQWLSQATPPEQQLDRRWIGRYKDGWALDLLTLRTLLMQRGMTILHTDTQYLPFLLGFLSRDHQEQGNTFQQEKRYLQEILKGAVLL